MEGLEGRKNAGDGGDGGDGGMGSSNGAVVVSPSDKHDDDEEESSAFSSSKKKKPPTQIRKTQSDTATPADRPSRSTTTTSSKSPPAKARTPPKNAVAKPPLNRHRSLPLQTTAGQRPHDESSSSAGITRNSHDTPQSSSSLSLHDRRSGPSCDFNEAAAAVPNDDDNNNKQQRRPLVSEPESRTRTSFQQRPTTAAAPGQLASSSDSNHNGGVVERRTRAQHNRLSKSTHHPRSSKRQQATTIMSRSLHDEREKPRGDTATTREGDDQEEIIVFDDDADGFDRSKYSAMSQSLQESSPPLKPPRSGPRPLPVSSFSQPGAVVSGAARTTRRTSSGDAVEQQQARQRRRHCSASEATAPSPTQRQRATTTWSDEVHRHSAAILALTQDGGHYSSPNTAQKQQLKQHQHQHLLHGTITGNDSVEPEHSPPCPPLVPQGSVATHDNTAAHQQPTRGEADLMKNSGGHDRPVVAATGTIALSSERSPSSSAVVPAAAAMAATAPEPLSDDNASLMSDSVLAAALPTSFAREENLRQRVGPGAASVPGIAGTDAGNNNNNNPTGDSPGAGDSSAAAAAATVAPPPVAANTRAITSFLVEEDELPDEDQIREEIEMRVNQRIEEHLDQIVAADMVVGHREEEQQQQQSVARMPEEAAVEEQKVPPEANRLNRRLRKVVIYLVAVVIPLAALGIVVWAALQRRERRGAQAGEAAYDATATTAPTASTSFDGVTEPIFEPTYVPCVPGRYYYTYNAGFKIGYVDLEDDTTGSHDLSTPDCSLWYLAFDSAGTAYGVCDNHGSLTLVAVDLIGGETTAVAEFPSLNYRMLAYDPAADAFFTTLVWPEDVSSLVKIDKQKNWTFTSVDGSSYEGPFNALTIDSNGNAFGVDARSPASLFSVSTVNGTTVSRGDFSPQQDPASIAFHGSTLYGIGYNVTASSLFVIEFTNFTSFTTTRIKSVSVDRVEGGAFCPL